MSTLGCIKCEGMGEIYSREYHEARAFLGMPLLPPKYAFMEGDIVVIEGQSESYGVVIATTQNIKVP